MTIAEVKSFGRYRVIRELGRGGEAIVHLAEDPTLKRLVAIKSFPLATAAEDVRGRESFRRETEALSRLDHPGICRIHDTGNEDGVPFIAMTYVEGDTLEGRGGVEPAEAARIAAEVARIVGAAHAAGIIHGDLKPQNVVVAPQGACFVLDFGVARFMDEALHVAASARPAGTLPYLAPECVARPPDERSDVYGVGAVLFELLTGRPPRQAPTRAALLQLILSEEAPLLRNVAPGLSRDFDAVLAKALARNPYRRYATMAELASDLDRLRRGEPPVARRIGAIGRAARWARRRPAAAALAAFVFGFLVVAACVTLVKNQRLGRYLERAGFESKRSIDEAATAEAHFERYARLADHLRLEDLERRARELVPPSPALLPALRSWQKEAEALARGLDAHRLALAELRLRGSRSTTALEPSVSGADRRRIERLRERHARLLAARASGQPAPSGTDATTEKNLRGFLERLEAPLPRVESWSYESPADAWHDATLSAVVEKLARFSGEGGTMRDVSRRIAEASLLASRLDASRDAWDRAREAIADRSRSPRYGGLAIQPQLGLVPLGQNPGTGLWEFLHVLSGAAPEDAPGATVLHVKPESGLVLVLLPGGKARMGARPPREGDGPDAPYVDAEAAPFEGPVDEVDLDPFFLAKTEITNTQWQRVLKGASAEPGKDATFPAIDVDWNEAVWAMERVGLALPTEAQWEYAARAGTSSPWWTGPDPGSLSGAEWFGSIDMARVGLLRPNAFGLHDVAGNVSEWCFDRFTRYESPRAAGTGDRLSLLPVDVRVWRGGSYGWPPPGLRSARRGTDSPHMRRADLGIRPARGLDR